MDYNTDRSPILMREYGRYIQQIVDNACKLPTREQRQQAAQQIIATMTKFSSEKGNGQEKQAKIWNHLAYISGYKLDIDYPVEIIQEKK